MTVIRQWLLVLIIIAVISVVINTFVLNNLTNQYFKGYVKDNYNQHLNQIVEYLTNTLKEANYSSSQVSVDLEAHLADPITRIKVYDVDGNLISDVSIDVQSYVGNSSMHGMMSRMMGNRINSQSEEVDHAQITDNGRLIGQVNITRYSSAENSATIWAFQSSLLKNSLISIIIVLIVAIGIGILVSKRMSRDLIHTCEMAQNLDIGNQINQDTIVLTIEDNGSGIDEKDLDKIFNAYYKNDKSMGLSGDGLGLYIAKENMVSIHGTIAVESEVNKGSKFILTFPTKIK